jgi:hypothetical protein
MFYAMLKLLKYLAELTLKLVTKTSGGVKYLFIAAVPTPSQTEFNEIVKYRLS